MRKVGILTKALSGFLKVSVLESLLFASRNEGSRRSNGDTNRF